MCAEKKFDPLENSAYEVVVGLEVHVQLNTRTKMFCRCENRFGAEPNTNVCPVCLGWPGALPYANREAIEQSLRAVLACGCEVGEFSKFDRKNYYYPDLPKGYQISQYDQPLGLGGQVDFLLDGEKAGVRLTRIHLEEDAGKNTMSQVVRSALWTLPGRARPCSRSSQSRTSLRRLRREPFCAISGSSCSILECRIAIWRRDPCAVT